jgi:DNA-binding XRE family transcriptional regulator
MAELLGVSRKTLSKIINERGLLHQIWLCAYLVRSIPPLIFGLICRKIMIYGKLKRLQKNGKK